MRCLALVASLMMLAAAPASALTFHGSINGPPSGFTQDFLFTFTGNSVVSASGTLIGGRNDLFYDADAEELQNSIIEIEDDCDAPGTCVAFASAGLTIQPNSIRIRMETPRGFYFCEPFGSVEGACGRFIATPLFNFEAVLAGSGNGAFIRTDSALTAIPEPALWFSLIGGLGLVGASARRRRHAGHCRRAA